MFNGFRNIGKKLSTEGNDTQQENKTNVSATPTSDKERARKKLLKVAGIISAILVVIFIVILLGTILIGRNYTYDQG